jgi:hypothetical protein
MKSAIALPSRRNTGFEATSISRSGRTELTSSLSDSRFHLSVGAGRELRREGAIDAMCGQRRSLRVTTIVLDL